MGGMLSNGIVVQLQRRADQEAFLRAFWEFRESVKRSLAHDNSCLPHSLLNEFKGGSPCFCNCHCQGPGVFYPHKNVVKQLDPQCLMRHDEIQTLWDNLHSAMDLIWNLLNKFDKLRSQNHSSFRVQYLQYNEHGAIDLLSWEARENKLFILYTICYLTIFPESEGEKGYVEKFEKPEDFKAFLEDLTMAQFVKISPLLRIFFQTHNFGERVSFFDPENDLENMVDFFFKRSFYNQISDTAFNVYTAALVYRNSMELNNFGEKRHRELEQLYQRRKLLKEKKKGFFSQVHLKNKHAKKIYHGIEVAAVKGQNVAEKITDKAYGMDHVQQEQQIEHPQRKSIHQVQHAVKSSFHLDGHTLQKEESEKIDTAPIDSMKQKTSQSEFPLDEVEEVIRAGLGKLAPQQNVFGKLMDRMSQSQEGKDRYISDYRSSLDKSVICFVLQASLNFGLLMMNPEVAIWKDEDEETPQNFMHFINCAIILFTFYYVMTMSISQFHIHTISVMGEIQGITSKLLIFANFFINTVLAMSLIFSTAVVLKRSSESISEIVLNSTAIYFLVDLDDMLLGSTDEEILEERVLFTYIYYIITLSKKQEKGAVAQFLREERWWLIIQGYASIAVLIYAFYAYFGSVFPRFIKY
mmetsp:Transcript_37177/g.48992  ORF Transcript_37177/g.48992 Transcript_37177/m.48992 type:complete len:636 (-) Transcript_37177:362-2269(-)